MGSTLPKPAHCKKFVPQGQRNRPYLSQRTAKNKLLPRSQQNRLQIRRSQKSKSTCLKVTEIDLYQVEHCKKINLPQGHRNRPHKSRHPIRGKIKNLPQGHRNRPHQRRHPLGGRIKKKSKGELEN